jgi:hypothetical protein
MMLPATKVERMTTEASRKLSKEDIAKYGGEGLCGYYAECNLFGTSKICHLVKGYDHLECPGDKEASKRLKERMKTDPEFAAKYQLVEDDEK